MNNAMKNAALLVLTLAALVLSAAAFCGARQAAALEQLGRLDEIAQR